MWRPIPSKRVSEGGPSLRAAFAFSVLVLLIPANVPHGTPVRLAEQARHRPVAAAGWCWKCLIFQVDAETNVTLAPPQAVLDRNDALAVAHGSVSSSSIEATGHVVGTGSGGWPSIVSGRPLYAIA